MEPKNFPISMKNIQKRSEEIFFYLWTIKNNKQKSSIICLLEGCAWKAFFLP